MTRIQNFGVKLAQKDVLTVIKLSSAWRKLFAFHKHNLFAL